MATLTATAYANEPRAIETGLISKTIEFNSGSTSIDVSATTILLCKLPNGATVVDMMEHHSCGAATCPADFGIDSTLSAFISGGAQATNNRMSVRNNIPYKVSVSDDATVRYGVFKATVTPGTATASVIIKTTIFYTMDA
jgi:hypothetical protein